MVSKPVESSEEVRVLLAELVTIMIKSTIADCFRAYLDDLLNILRMLAMDPFGDVVREACNGIYEISQSGTELLHHFTINLARSTFRALVHKHAKVRVSGLKALNSVIYCGAWKYSNDVFEMLVGFRDPNLVAIKDFFEYSTKFNYLANFVTDNSLWVRETFYKTIANWLLKLPDKKDHEGRLFPYILSGLNDKDADVQKLCFELIEEMGEQFEEEEEEKFRDKKQYDFDTEWTLGRKEFDIPFPHPIAHRPRLGSRTIVKGYTRRYLHALYREITDWLKDGRERSSKLLLSCIVYTENYMTQFLDDLFIALYKGISEN